MNFGEIFALTVIAFVISQTNAIGIDDKLDFGGEGRHHTAFRNVENSHKNSYLLGKHFPTVAKVETSNDFDNVDIVCGSEGCNTSKITDNFGDSIKTHVVVHIETKIDSNHSKTKPNYDVPDVPIIIGTDTPKDNINHYDGATPEPKTIYIPSSGSHNYQHSGSRITGSNIYSNNPSYPSSMSSYPYHTNTRIDSAYKNIFKQNPEVNINIKSLPPVVIDPSVVNRGTNIDQSNGFELPLPYFDPYLHNHHYGENPPQQYVFYPKKTSTINPVEFKVMKPNWKPSTWQNQFTPHSHSVSPMGKEVRCFCENGNLPMDLHWYPSNNRRSSAFSSDRKVSINDPGSQISDKLGSFT